MYEAYWNLNAKPFRNAVDRKFFFYGESYEEAYLRLLYTINESKGLLLLVGEGGCGKSFISKIFTKDMLEQGHKVALVTNPDLEPKEFLEEVLCEFGLDASNKSKGELLRELKRFLLESLKQGKHSVLIVDEAHLIQNEKTWEEIRLLLNMEEENRLLLSIIISGRPTVLDSIQKIPSLYERTGLQYRLKPLSCRETGEYIYFRMEKAGCSREIFTADGIKEVYAYSGGIPRKINNICDLSLLLGYGDNSIVVDQALVKKASIDLKGISNDSNFEK
ncbi:MAG: AAA family ATPase [Candidatus Brocadiae bacterium]|nr:AAA family ATPase [Candidatus Brocadiia bacterium]